MLLKMGLILFSGRKCSGRWAIHACYGGTYFLYFLKLLESTRALSVKPFSASAHPVRTLHKFNAKFMRF